MNEMTNSIETQLRALVDNQAHRLSMLASFMSHGSDIDLEEIADDDDLAAIWAEFFNDGSTDTLEVEEVTNGMREEALDVTLHGTRAPGGEWNKTGLVVLLACGGPRIEYDSRTGQVSGCWGTARCSASVSDSDVVEEFFGLDVRNPE